MPSDTHAMQQIPKQHLAVPLRHDALEGVAMPESQAAQRQLPVRRLPAQARMVQMLVNPMAGSSKRKRLADDLALALQKQQYQVERFSNTDELASASRAAHLRGDLRCVIAVGGDGTLAAALNTTPPGAPLLLAPQGTENLLAKYMRFTPRPSDLLRLVDEGLVVDLDAGVANGRLFSLMASVGFDAAVVHRVHQRRSTNGSGNISHLSYAHPIFSAMWRYPFPSVRVTAYDATGAELEPVEGSWVVGVNLPRYASGLRIAPWARGDDGLLDLCVLKRGQTAAGLWYLWHILRGRHHRLRSVATMRVARCRIESVDGDDVLAEDVPFQIDGDPGGHLPLELSVERGRMSLLTSRSTVRRLEKEWKE